MENNVPKLWNPIEFSDHWRNADTSLLDGLLPEWFKFKTGLKAGSGEYEKFIVRLKNLNSIEAVVADKFFAPVEGIANNLIIDCVLESYMKHLAPKVPLPMLTGYLQKHFDVMDSICEIVNDEKPLTIDLIKQLHKIVTQYQDYSPPITGKKKKDKKKVKLVKGEFKRADDNLRREDGRVFKTVPSIQVDFDMNKLIEIYSDLCVTGVHPVIIAAWFHHTFTMIQPFEDGNGRIARLIASFTLIRGGLFPFIPKKEQTVLYLNALEKADVNVPQELVNFFCLIQKSRINLALDNEPESLTSNTLKENAKLFTDKTDELNAKNIEEKREIIEKNRIFIFAVIHVLLSSVRQELFELIPYEKAKIYIQDIYPSDERSTMYSNQIGMYAKFHNYHFSKNMPRGWFKISFVISDTRKYDLIITVHHYKDDPMVIAIGAFLEYTQNTERRFKGAVPINLQPYLVLLTWESESHMPNIDKYIHALIRNALAIISKEI
jgi:fido (protein-threonine AMPylation protein)